MVVRRGDLAIAAAPGDYGKPRPVLVLQSDTFSDTSSIVVALLTSHRHPESPLFRRAIQPAAHNGLIEPSDVMLDKLVSMRREKIGKVIGQLSSVEMAEIAATLAIFLGA